MLVEKNFKEQRQVRFYASLLHRSPKTLTNFFAKYNHRSPLGVIQDRVILEARRLMLYTDMSGKQIANELGFVSATHFSHFFKRNTGYSISEFRSKIKEWLLEEENV